MPGKKRRSLARGGESLARRAGFRNPRKTILVLCEGERSEPEYIQALSRQREVREVAAVQIVLDAESFGSSPMTLVRRAVDQRKRATEDNAEVDEVWCVFDVEWPGSSAHHPRLQEAVQMAKVNEVKVAISNPSFELWLILHFRDCHKFLTNAHARRLRVQCDGSTGKGFPDNNPSSGMHLLVVSATTPVGVPDQTV